MPPLCTGIHCCTSGCQWEAVHSFPAAWLPLDQSVRNIGVSLVALQLENATKVCCFNAKAGDLLAGSPSATNSNLTDSNRSSGAFALLGHFAVLVGWLKLRVVTICF